MVLEFGCVREASMSFASEESTNLRYCSISLASELPNLLRCHNPVVLCLLSLIAIEISFGKRSLRTKA